jgi:hypothetical protein
MCYSLSANTGRDCDRCNTLLNYRMFRGGRWDERKFSIFPPSLPSPLPHLSIDGTVFCHCNWLACVCSCIRWWTSYIYEAQANMNYNLFVVQKCSAVRWK